jgi:hypothetical protein
MQQAIEQFRINIDRARHLSTIFQAFEDMTTDVIDLSDVLRSEIVLAVSALDHFIHDLVRLGMLDIFQGKRPFTKAYNKFPVPLHTTHSAISDLQNIEWLDSVIRQSHGWKSFQTPNNIADAIRLIVEKNLWDEVGDVLNLSAEEVKTKLKAIVDRRNKIAHEADLDPTLPNARWPITRSDIDQSVDFVHSVGEAIYQVVRS